MDYNARLKEIQSALRREGVDGFFVDRASDIFYLTGADFAADASLFITKSYAIIITDSRYAEEAKHIESEAVRSMVSPKGRFLGFIDFAAKRRIRHIAVSGHISLAVYRELKKKLSVRLSKKLNALLSHLRMKKDKDELDIIKRNIALHKKAFAAFLKKAKGLCSEKGLVAVFEYEAKRLGADDTAFPTIVANPKNASRPHHAPGKWRVSSRRWYLMDCGIWRYGYRTDLTRIIGKDKMTREESKAYSVLEKVKDIVFENIRPGVRASFLDGVARACLREHNYDVYFTHSLGHGVGIDIHEPPYLSPTSRDVLEKGMVFTIEPGIYIPGRYGIRVENMVVVTQNGVDVLSRDVEVH